MKKVLLMGFCLLMTLILSLSSCGGLDKKVKFCECDSTESIEDRISDLVCPTFISAEEVLIYRQTEMDMKRVDSVFYSIPEGTLINVCSVLVKKNGDMTKRSIVEEYESNSSIYKNLPAASEKEIDLSATDLGNRLQESISFRTDTVNGKPIRIKITKTEEVDGN